MENYPELEKLAHKIADNTSHEINKKIRNIKSEMPYKAKYTLERVIEILQERV
jgi:hypothetical protein